MAGVHLHPQVDRVLAPLVGVLQGGRKLVGVGRHHPVVGVGGGGENRRIGLAGSDVVVGRIGEQVTRWLRPLTNC